jgi:hypothetical protein
MMWVWVFSICFGDFAGFVGVDDDLLPRSKGEIILWDLLKTSHTDMIIFCIDDLVYSVVNVYFYWYPTKLHRGPDFLSDYLRGTVSRKYNSFSIV